MKNLSLMETRKLVRVLPSQRRAVATIRAAAEDFLAHFPGLPTLSADAGSWHVLIGAERGFCGSYNEAVVEALEGRAEATAPEPARLVAVGSRLAAALQGDYHPKATLRGPTAVEEVPAALNALVQTLSHLAATPQMPRLDVIHWDAEENRVVCVPVLPPFLPEGPGFQAKHPFPPLLNLAPNRFLERLIEHYLFAALHEIFFSALTAEHQHRLRHLDGALGRVAERSRELGLRRNVLRQEEITEEIELIMLNLPPTGAGRRPQEDAATPGGTGPDLAP